MALCPPPGYAYEQEVGYTCEIYLTHKDFFHVREICKDLKHSYSIETRLLQ